MDVIYKSCCGIDVHKDKLVACLKIKGKKDVIKEFSGQTEDIRLMANWLLENKCEKVAMESTASYWKPLVNIFDITKLDYTVINAREYKNLPGKKTDVKDSEWIADLLQHGLLKDSYIPSREQRELREATRYRKSLVQERARGLNRLQKMLEGANIKITTQLSEVLGITSRNLIEYVLENDEALTIEKANELVVTRIHAKLEDVVRAMNGIITPFQKTMMKEVIKHIDELTKRIAEMDELIDEYMKEYEKNKKKLEKMPGIGKRTSEIILAEIGQDMSRFPTAGHISSWSGVCPGNNESAGKRRSGKSRKGNKILKSTLVECAQAAVKHKNSFFYAQYQRISMRRGKKRALLAVAHTMLIAIYYMIKEDKEFVDLGSDFYNKFNKEKKANAYIKKLKELGYDVQLNIAQVS
jgi:transposase